MTEALFITGTDTSVGKTFIAGALARGLSDEGYRVGVLKPVESGCERIEGVMQPADALYLQCMSRCEAALDLINPYAFEAPITPALAAEQEGVIVDFDSIRACFDALATSHDIVLVEGAGGLLAPVFAELTGRDLAHYLSLPLVVVTANRLGAINHTALTIEAARSWGLEVAGIVLNSAADMEDAATESNATSLQRWGGAPLLFSAPYLPRPDEDTVATLGAKLVAAFVDEGWLPARRPHSGVRGAI